MEVHCRAGEETVSSCNRNVLIYTGHLFNHDKSMEAGQNSIC